MNLLLKVFFVTLKGLFYLGIPFTPGPLDFLTGCTDSVRTGCPSLRNLQLAFVFLDTNLISFTSKKQPTVSQTSAKAEYKTLAVTTLELLPISNMADLGISQTNPQGLFYDNIGATYMAVNPIFHAWTKHVQWTIICDLVMFGRDST